MTQMTAKLSSTGLTRTRYSKQWGNLSIDTRKVEVLGSRTTLCDDVKVYVRVPKGEPGAGAYYCITAPRPDRHNREWENGVHPLPGEVAAFKMLGLKAPSRIVFSCRMGAGQVKRALGLE